MSEASTLTEMFDQAVARFGPRPCLEFLGAHWTYTETAQLVARARAGLQAMGVKPGDRVGLCLPNTPDAVIGYYAILGLGAVVVNFSPLSPPVDLANQARDAGVGVMITINLTPILDNVLTILRKDAIKAVVVCDFTAALPPPKRWGFRLLKRKLLSQSPTSDARVQRWERVIASSPMPSARVSPDDLAVLQYTGGTTGTPKGVMLTHANLTANATQLRAWMPDSVPGAERELVVLPLFHVFAMTVAMNVPLGWGAELVLLPKFDIDMLREALKRRRPTIVPGVPTLFKAMLDKGLTNVDLASVKVCISGGAPLPHEVQRAFEAAAGCDLVEGYGLTEASPVCFCNPIGRSGRDGTIGIPLSRIEAQIHDLADPSIIMPHGERGELWVRGPNVMRGYWNNPEATAEALTPDGWLRTGDVGIMDADGYVELVDRIKDLILCSGFNVYPRRIEEALYLHPDVTAAIAVGEPDEYRGESVAAFVQIAPGARVTTSELLEFLRDKLTSIEMPRRLEFRQELPRTAVGKLSRKELRSELLPPRSFPQAIGKT